MKFILIFVLSSFLSTSGWAGTEANRENIRRLDTMSPGTKIIWRFPFLVYANAEKIKLEGLIDVKGVGSNTVPVYRSFLDEFRNGWWYVPASPLPSQRYVSGTLVVDHAGYSTQWEAIESPYVIVTTTYTIYLTSGDRLTSSRSESGLFDNSFSPMYFDDFVAAASPIFSSVVEP